MSQDSASETNDRNTVFLCAYLHSGWSLLFLDSLVGIFLCTTDNALAVKSSQI